MTKPSGSEVITAFKTLLLQEGRLSEQDVLSLHWIRGRWGDGDKFVLEYPVGADLKRLRDIFYKNFDLWESLLPWSVDLTFGESFDVIPDLPQETLRSDAGNATRLVHWYGGLILFCHPWRRWLIWDGKRWGPDRTGRIMEIALMTARRILAEAASHSDKAERKALANWAIRSESRERIKSMVELAQHKVAILPEQLDADAMALNVANGVLNLRTGELLPHNPDVLITKLADVDYNPEATCPLWLKFLAEVLGDDTGLITFVQRAVGYALTGDVSERALFILYGLGANGKTTFVETLRALFGGYGLRTPTETLMVKRMGGIPNDVARLKGARFVTASESEEGRRLAESLVKDLTGRDTISARFMRAEWFDFSPVCKIWLATNHRPEIRGTDRAIWDRIRLIPFEVTIPEEAQDRQLAEKLKAELPGILAWAVRGCLDWQKHGLGMAEKVRAATSTYRRGEDILGGFIADCCIEGPDSLALAGDLHQAYKAWGGDLSQRRFGRALRERGYIKGRHSSGRVTWAGLGLISRTIEPFEPQNNITLCVQNSTSNNRPKGSEGSEGSGIEGDVEPCRPENAVTKSNESLGAGKAEKGSEGSDSPQTDPVIGAAEDLGGQVVNVDVDTVDGPVKIPF